MFYLPVCSSIVKLVGMVWDECGSGGGGAGGRLEGHCAAVFTFVVSLSKMLNPKMCLQCVSVCEEMNVKL